MKTAVVALFTWLLNVKFNFLPNVDLLVVMGIVIALDLITGVIKSVLLQQARTSEGYRKTVVKFLQYGGAVSVGIVLKYVSIKQAELPIATKYVDWLTSGLLVYIIFIEITSICENIYQAAPDTPFAKYFIKKILLVLTFQLKNNPINKFQEEDKTDKNEKSV